MSESVLSIVPAQGAESRPDHRNFVRYVMSDIYALLDYLSGRAVPSLTPLPDPRPRNGSVVPRPDNAAAPAGSSDHRATKIDHDPRDNGFARVMRIGKQLDSKNGDILAADAAFLIDVRDQLNGQASPATGSSIVFTIRVVRNLHSRHAEKHAAVQDTSYLIADKHQDDVAGVLANFVSRSVSRMLILLTVTVILSTYIACGKLLLDTWDAVNRDIGGNRTAVAAEINHANSEAKTDLVAAYCDAAASTFVAYQSCQDRNELVARRQAIHGLLRVWEIGPLVHAMSDTAVEQWATTLIGVMGNYLLPVLYGALGSLGFVLRRLNRQLADCLLTPRDLRANKIRIILGTVTGACIGLFVNSSAGAATLQGLGGAAVTLSASGLSFLAGYGVEAVFNMLDGVISHVFKVNGDSKHA